MFALCFASAQSSTNIAYTFEDLATELVSFTRGIVLYHRHMIPYEHFPNHGLQTQLVSSCLLSFRPQTSSPICTLQVHTTLVILERQSFPVKLTVRIGT